MTAPAGLRTPPGAQGPGRIAPRQVDALDLLVARRASGALPGERAAPGVGAGTELAQLRPYVVGDDVRQLDPAASARTGIPHVRLQVPERLLTTWLVLDVSASMAFGTSARLKSDVAAGVVRVVGRLAIRRGGRVGLLTAGSPVDRLLPPRGGRGALAALERAIAEGVAVDGAAVAMNLAGALTRLGRLARRPGLVVVISDLRGPLDWQRPMRTLAARHSVLAAEVRDPREEELVPAGRLALVDPESGRRVDVDTGDGRLRERFAAAERERAEAVAGALRGARASHTVLSTGRPWLNDLGRVVASAGRPAPRYRPDARPPASRNP